MVRILRSAMNPLSTAFAGWWCHSSLRALLTGRPLGARRRRPGPSGPMDPDIRQARIAAIEQALGADHPAGLGST